MFLSLQRCVDKHLKSVQGKAKISLTNVMCNEIRFCVRFFCKILTERIYDNEIKLSLFAKSNKSVYLKESNLDHFVLELQKCFMIDRFHYVVHK